MGVWWNSFGTIFSCFLVLLLVLEIQGGWSLNDEGLTLLQFRDGVHYDPHDALASWNPHDADPCSWYRVYCNNGKVEILDLNSLSLEGTIAPELGRLYHLRSLVLYKNHFSGAIPKELGRLLELELLDLRRNDLSGIIPEELGKNPSLKNLLLFDDKLEDHIPLEINRVNLVSELQFEENVVSAMSSGIDCVNKKLVDSILSSSSGNPNKEDSRVIPTKGVLIRLLNSIPLPLFKFGNLSRHDCTDSVSFGERRILQQATGIPGLHAPLPEPSSTNIPALPPPLTPAPLFPDPTIILPASRSSGGFPAVMSAKKTPTAPSSSPSPADPPKTLTPVPAQQSNHKPGDTSGTNIWERYRKYIIIFLAVNLLLVVAVVVFIMFRRRGIAAIRPWKTGLSGQLQKAFVTGVPKLNRAELDIACEDFSNIIETLDGCTIYKGTLSSGVEIAVVSAGVKSLKDWSSSSENAFRKKIDTLSRVNHKNFVNLIGYCEENEPFTRMMVFEYAPNGTLFEHLHVQEVDHLDWSARMRIIMGIAYYFQYTHHDLNPPVTHPDLNSKNIVLTDDYAAKIMDVIFSPNYKCKSKASGEEESSELPPLADTKANVYSFGILLLETISGKLPFSEEHGSLVDWGSKYLSDKNSIQEIVDPTLKSFKNKELDMIREAIQDCIEPDPSQRPTMKEIVSRFREVLPITPEQAVPRLSPLWWAELEILSVEAA